MLQGALTEGPVSLHHLHGISDVESLLQGNISGFCKKASPGEKAASCARGHFSAHSSQSSLPYLWQRPDTIFSGTRAVSERCVWVFALIKGLHSSLEITDGAW